MLLMNFCLYEAYYYYIHIFTSQLREIGFIFKNSFCIFGNRLTACEMFPLRNILTILMFISPYDYMYIYNCNYKIYVYIHRGVFCI